MTRETECLGRGKQSSVTLQQAPTLSQYSYSELSRYKTVTVTFFFKFQFLLFTYLYVCTCVQVSTEAKRGCHTPGVGVTVMRHLTCWKWNPDLCKSSMLSYSPSHLSSSYFSFSLNSNCFLIEYKCKNIKIHTQQQSKPAAVRVTLSPSDSHF